MPSVLHAARTWGENETTLVCEAPPHRNPNRIQTRKWLHRGGVVGRWGRRGCWGRNRRCVLNPNACGSEQACPRSATMVTTDQRYRRRSSMGAVSALCPPRLRLSNPFHPETRVYSLPPPVDQTWRASEPHSSSESMPSSMVSPDDEQERDVRTNCPMVLHRSK